jgi:hypothetical protein
MVRMGACVGPLAVLEEGASVALARFLVDPVAPSDGTSAECAKALVVAHVASDRAQNGLFRAWHTGCTPQGHSCTRLARSVRSPSRLSC